MKVYLVIYDNGEEYENYDEWVEAVMSSREKAENYQPLGDFPYEYYKFNRIEEFTVDEPNFWEKEEWED